MGDPHSLLAPLDTAISILVATTARILRSRPGFEEQHQQIDTVNPAAIQYMELDRDRR